MYVSNDVCFLYSHKGMTFYQLHRICYTELLVHQIRMKKARHQQKVKKLL